MKFLADFFLHFSNFTIPLVFFFYALLSFLYCTHYCTSAVLAPQLVTNISCSCTSTSLVHFMSLAITVLHMEVNPSYGTINISHKPFSRTFILVLGTYHCFCTGKFSKYRSYEIIHLKQQISMHRNILRNLFQINFFC